MTVEALRRGRPEVLADLLVRYGHDIQAVAYLIVRDRAAAEDVVADSLLAALDQAGIVIGLGRVLFLGDATVVFDPGSETFMQGGQIGIADADAVVPLRDGRILMVGYQLEAALLDPRAVP